MVAVINGVLMAATTGYPACNTVLQSKTARLGQPGENPACGALMAIVSRERPSSVKIKDRHLYVTNGR